MDILFNEVKIKQTHSNITLSKDEWVESNNKNFKQMTSSYTEFNQELLNRILRISNIVAYGLRPTCIFNTKMYTSKRIKSNNIAMLQDKSIILYHCCDEFISCAVIDDSKDPLGLL